MKKRSLSTKIFLNLLLVSLLISLFSSCGEEEPSKPNSSFQIFAEDVSTGEEIFSKDDGYDMFSRHGLSGIVPAEYTSVTKVAETEENAAILLTQYEFTVRSSSDPKLERQQYYNQILTELRKASSDNSVYKYDSDFEKYPVYEDTVPEGEVMKCYFYLDQTLYLLSVEDLSSSQIHLYSLTLTLSNLESKP